MLKIPDPVVQRPNVLRRWWSGIAEFFAEPAEFTCPICGPRNVNCDNRACPMGEHSSMSGRR